MRGWRQVKLTPAQKGEAFKQIVDKIHQVDSTWMAEYQKPANGVALFTGEGRPFGLAIDNEGQVWSTDNIRENTTIDRTALTTIDYSKWKKRK
ncbi:hypothetical protein LVJ94_24700 [Pendulispora rubella]|uniref:Uncharacterized protein n=1 Tax=Pendulispora rubella TaxID=2741070 RepID=A0ABZ2LHI7_9BACT